MHRGGSVKTKRGTGWRGLWLTPLVLGLTAVAAWGQEPAGFQSAWSQVRTSYRQALEREGMVGSSLWLVHDGRVLAHEFYGMADLAQQRPVDENTIFHWASITKTFTAIGIMQLRDRGLLDLDDPVVKYVPELRAVYDPYGPVSAITLRQLMTHSAGFRDPTWPWGGDESWQPFEPKHWSQLVAMMPYTKILFPPGSKYSYSNPGIIFLGRTIERLTDDDYEVYIDKNILKPLGMVHSYYDITPYHLLPYRSNSYRMEDGRPVALGLDFDTGITTSNGGLNAPITDMVKYLDFLMGDPARQAEYDAILKRSSLTEMWRPALPTGDTAITDRPGSKEWIALNYFVEDRGGMRFIGHTGSQHSFLSFFYVDPASRTAAIAAFNTDDGTGPNARPNTRRVLNDLREQLFREIFPLFRRK